MPHIRDIYIRDPFILTENGRYYMYASHFPTFVVYTATDLENWSEPKVIFERPADFWSDRDFWAPECHFYKGNFYIFTSVWSETTQKRCISVYRADNPLGPFEDIASGRITPAGWDAIDGTL